MTLKQRLYDELNRFQGLSISAGAAQTLAIDLDHGRLECTLTAVDQLACAFDQLAYQSAALEQLSIDQLDRIALALSKQLSYLLESISPVERDQEGCVVQMRSNPPHKDDDGTSYYELVVRRGEISLCRYSKASGQTRRRIPAHVTREVFFRLANDLATTT